MSRDELIVGLNAVRRAARLCEAVRKEMVNELALDKSDRSPVTIADFGAQAVVCREIAGSFPGDAIVAEEASDMLREVGNADHLEAVARFVSAEVGATNSSEVCEWIDRGSGTPTGRYWVLDPIDGTKGFLRQDQYAVALALIEEGAVQWGFLACPVLHYPGGQGIIFVARRGGGTQCFTLDGQAVGGARVSEVVDPSRARVAVSVESAHTNRGLAAMVKQELALSTEPLRMDSQAKYAAVARGEADIYLRSPNSKTPDYRENIWDHAAGWLVVEEAGGRVTDVYGRSLDWSRGRRLEENIGVLATNGHLHEAVLAALQTHLPPVSGRP